MSVNSSEISERDSRIESASSALTASSELNPASSTISTARMRSTISSSTTRTVGEEAVGPEPWPEAFIDESLVSVAQSSADSNPWANRDQACVWARKLAKAASQSVKARRSLRRESDDKDSCNLLLPDSKRNDDKSSWDRLGKGCRTSEGRARAVAFWEQIPCHRNPPPLTFRHPPQPCPPHATPTQLGRRRRRPRIQRAASRPCSRPEIRSAGSGHGRRIARVVKPQLVGRHRTRQ